MDRPSDDRHHSPVSDVLEFIGEFLDVGVDVTAWAMELMGEVVAGAAELVAGLLP